MRVFNPLYADPLCGFALEGGFSGGGVVGPCGWAGGAVGGLGGVLEASSFFAEGLEPGGLGAESADLLRGRLGNEVAHEGDFIVFRGCLG